MGPLPTFRIPYTHILPPAQIHPPSATTLSSAVSALVRFLLPPGSSSSTTILTGAGLSVSSGLADYRGTHGTYRVNRAYRPIYHPEFLASHAARRRYWARSFLGWGTLADARPTAAHRAIAALGRLGAVGCVVTQNVDSFHPRAHPGLQTVELHGYLRSTVCVSCRTEFDRGGFQRELARLNPAWQRFLEDVLSAEDKRAALGVRTNPDGDVDVPGAPYATFRYPPCQNCLAHPPEPSAPIQTDLDGAWVPSPTTTPSTLGVLKPAVVMFGESIAPAVRTAAEAAVDDAARLMVVATSLATYSALRLARRAKDAGKPVAIVNVGGVRGEDELVEGMVGEGEDGVRVEMETDVILPALVEALRRQGL